MDAVAAIKRPRRQPDSADANESGAAPRIVSGPKGLLAAKLNEPLLLTCLAQGSPRPTIRWFRASSEPNAAAADDWQELVPTAGGGNGRAANQTDTRFQLSAGSNLLLVRQLQLGDQRSKLKCLANNSFGAHQVEAEIRLDVWPLAKLVQVEPTIEYVTSGGAELVAAPQAPAANNQRAQSPIVRPLVLNCTIRASSQPLLGVEWLRNGRKLVSATLASAADQLQAPAGSGSASPQQAAGAELAVFYGAGNATANYLSASMFDEPNLELNLIEQTTLGAAGGGWPQPVGDENEPAPAGQEELGDDEELGGLFEPSNRPPAQVVTTSLNKLSAAEPSRTATNKLRQSLRLLNRDTLLYQLHLPTGRPLRRNERGAYQCRARLARTTLHATSQLLLKDNPPQFVETFQSQLVARNQQSAGASQQQQLGASLKCVASGEPLPEIIWTLSGFPVPDSSRFRVGDYVTRDGLIVSFVNITNVQVEGKLNLKSSARLFLLPTCEVH